MKKFKISQLALFSGVKPHTIRIWEQRFAIFKPSRTEGNVRFYSLEEVKLLLDIALLIPFGHRISHLSKLKPSALTHLVDELSVPEAIPCKAINDLIVLMFSSEIEEFEDVLDGCVHVLGIEETVNKVVLPFMERVQLFSYNNTEADVHFTVTALRKKIITAIENANPPAMLQKTALLFLPEREHYDLMLLYAAFILKRKGLRVMYLGTNISRQNLEQITILKKPDFLLTYIPQKQKFTFASFLSFLQYHLPSSQLLVLACEPPDTNNTHQNAAFVHYKELEEWAIDQPIYSFSAS